MRPTIIKLMYV